MRQWSAPEQDCKRAGRGRKGSSRSAFTLAELLSVMLVLGTLYGGLVLGSSGPMFGDSSPATLSREAERAASWLQRVFYKALLSGRGFYVRVHSVRSQPRIVIHWNSPLEDEVYDAGGRAFFINHSLYGELPSHYTPKWNMLTPALTVRVVPSEGPRRDFKNPLFIVVSPYGRITLRDTPP